MKNIENLTIDKSVIKKGARKAQRNEEIACLYLELGEKRGNIDLIKKYDTLLACFKTFDIDYYQKQKVKDIKKVYKCHDIFCVNCQSQLAKERFLKYGPFLDSLRDYYDIYHVTFTVVDPLGPKLKDTVDRMYDKFPYIIKYFFGTKNKKLNLEKFGFVGAIRTLEITSKMTEKGIEYHPHFHCYFLFKKGTKKLITQNKVHINDFSFSKRSSAIRKFSDFEIFMQKLWYLTYNGDEKNKVTLKALEELKQGYSGVVEPVKPGQYHEVFKYVLKGTFKDNVFAEDIDSFRYLYDTLHKRKIIQGYGIFHNFKFSVDDGESERLAEYESLIKSLSSVEDPKAMYEQLDYVMDSMQRGVRYISKRRIGSSEDKKKKDKKKGKKK